MTLEASGATMPKGFTGFRVTPSPIGSAAAIPRMARPGAAVESGQFAVSDLMAGYYVIRAAAPSGWTMKAVYIDGRDVTDQPIEVRSENITGVNVIFTDKISGLTGTIRDQRGTAAAGVMVIAFPADDKLWLPQSRQIVTARTDPSGTYKLTAPPGDYLVIASDDVEQGEWFDPAFLDAARDRATRAKIGEGEQRTLDLKVPSS
jgi:hypothetical protein